MAKKIEADINKDILVWAREQASFSTEYAAECLRVSEDKLIAWESGSILPSLNQLNKIASFYHRPVITFFMTTPPIVSSSLKDFRTIGDTGLSAPSTSFTALKLKIEVLHDTLLEIAENDNFVERPYVGSISLDTPVNDVVTKIKELLKWEAEKNSEPKKHTTPEGYFSFLREKIQNIGIFVMLKGDLGSHHSKVLPDEFRGICIADRKVPLIVVNPNDTKNALVFTLVHEFVHILLGDSAISNGLSADTQIQSEIFCNKITGEYLVPSAALVTSTAEQKCDIGLITDLSTRFCVSQFVISRRMFDVGLLKHQEYQTITKLLKNEWEKDQKKRKLLPKNVDGGPNPNVVAHSYIGRRLLATIINAADDGIVSYTQAAAALGIKPSRFEAVLG